MSNQIKMLRGQLRQLVLELMPEVLKEEIVKESEKKIMARLEAMEKQQKNILGYLLRVTSTPVEKK